jgi:hypothetical protein
MSNDRLPAHLRALKIGAQAMGALAIGALAIGALSIGALAIGRLVIGRSRIRRLAIDELVVARLHVTASVPSTPATKNDPPTKETKESFNLRPSLEHSTSCSDFSLGSASVYRITICFKYAVERAGEPTRLQPMCSIRAGKRYLVARRGHTQWVRNAIASGIVSFKKGRRSEEFRIRSFQTTKSRKSLRHISIVTS